MRRRTWYMVAVLVLLGAIYLLLFDQSTGVFRSGPKATTNNNDPMSPTRQAEDRLDKWQDVYHKIGWDLPEYYFVPMEDMTKGEPGRIRIWDTGNAGLDPGTCEDDLEVRLEDKGLAAYWRGPYMVCPPTGTEYVDGRPMAVVDPWGRRYRMFYYRASTPEQHAPGLEDQLLQGDDGWGMVIISGGEDGLLRSCAADKSTPSSVEETAPYVETATKEDFQHFEPFHPHVADTGLFRLILRSAIKQHLDERRRVYRQRFPDRALPEPSPRSPDVTVGQESDSETNRPR